MILLLESAEKRIRTKWRGLNNNERRRRHKNFWVYKKLYCNYLTHSFILKKTRQKTQQWYIWRWTDRTWPKILVFRRACRAIRHRSRVETYPNDDSCYIPSNSTYVRRDDYNYHISSCDIDCCTLVLLSQRICPNPQSDRLRSNVIDLFPIA